MFTITRRFEFEAAHFLTAVPPGHKCARMHGHNYVVQVELSGAVLDDRGFVVDYGDLTVLQDYIDTTLDHRVLNEVLTFEPTAECLAAYLHDWCKERWPQTSAVRVEETRGTSAEFRPRGPVLPW